MTRSDKPLVILPPSLGDLVDQLYLGLLGREAESAGHNLYVECLKSGRSLPQLLGDFTNSEEFFCRYIATNWNRYGASTLATLQSLMFSGQVPHVLHQVRLEMIRTLLPAGQQILDLGGASDEPQGALMSFGYPHQPAEVVIIDLPAPERFYATVDLAAQSTFGANTFGRSAIRYEYQSMADLSNFASSSFDFIWSGETIEHITKDEGIRMLADVQRILKPGGRFALDTPNRTLTRLQVGIDNFIHPEHKHEYIYEELVEVLSATGFHIERAKGLIAMPRSVAEQAFYPDELIANACINDSPELSYVFYLECTSC